jgi:hypothetical protein
LVLVNSLNHIKSENESSTWFDEIEDKLQLQNVLKSGCV